MQTVFDYYFDKLNANYTDNNYTDYTDKLLLLPTGDLVSPL